MFSNLQAEMARKSITRGDLAKALKLSSASLYNKMYGLREWKLNEMEDTKALLGTDATFDYLFQR